MALRDEELEGDDEREDTFGYYDFEDDDGEFDPDALEYEADDGCYNDGMYDDE